MDDNDKRTNKSILKLWQQSMLNNITTNLWHNAIGPLIGYIYLFMMEASHTVCHAQSNQQQHYLHFRKELISIHN